MKPRNAAKNDIQREIITQFYLANIPLELQKIDKYENIARAIIKLRAAHGVFINEHDAVERLVSLMCTQNALLSFGAAAKNAAKAMNKMVGVMPELPKPKKKNNWRTKTIWERVGK